MSYRFAAMLLAGCASVCAADAATITNGNFETSGPAANGFAQVNIGDSTTIPGWTVVANDGTTTDNGRNIAILGNGAYGLDTPFGTDFLDLTGYSDAAPYAGVAQSFATIANQGYTVTFWLGVSTTDPSYIGPASVIARAAGSAVSITNSGRGFQLANNTQWTQQMFNFTASGALTTLSIVGNTSTGGRFIGLDNISIADRNVTAAPEPATWTMMVAGFGLVGAGLRRRSAVRFA